MHKVLGAFLLLMSSAVQADSIQYDFSYTFGDGEQLYGSLLGTLQVDGDTIVIDDVLAMNYTEILSSDCCIPSPEPFNATWDGGGFVSLSGSAMDFKSNPPYPQDYWALSYTPLYGPGAGVFDGYFDITCLDSCGEFVQGEAFNAANWQITAVPLPPAVLMFASGIAMLGWLRQKSQSG